MPIRFRCVYCDKLLGIATRKAGTVVNCPQCGQPLIVPTPEAEPEKATAPSNPSQFQATMPPTAPSKLFERDDFDVVLQSDVTVAATESAPPPIARRSKSSPPPVPSPLPPKPFAIEQNLPAPPRDYPAPLPLPVPKRAPGLTLSTGMLILMLAVVLFLVIAAFGAGVLVGRLMNATPAG